MKERGIIFNGEMVRAILDGRKTQTRRILSPRQLKMIDTASSIGECDPLDCGLQDGNSQSYYREWCPFGKVGDRLWVREAFRVHSRATDVATLAYKASEQQSWTQQVARVQIELCTKQVSPEAWTPSIHMPRWASRITLEITDIRVERLNDISEDDAKAEGAPTECCVIGDKHLLGFRSLWKSIYGQDSWQSNPFVWVVEFKRVEEA
ncbi:hypothetical protein [Rosenbergiella australiborealis]|uniref:hypothetical protein n=1 Tax=Rosenbergiella australiborealis TaxID=1544696 RepID=UPI003B84994D